jgi:hypothetical protein
LVVHTLLERCCPFTIPGCHVLQPSRGAACEYLIRETNGKTMFVNKIDIKSEKVVLLELFLLNSYEVFCQTK